MTPEPIAALVAGPPADLALEIVRLAANPELDTAKLQALIDMQAALLRAQAEAAFNEAFCAMQGDLPIVPKTAMGDSGKWWFAPLDTILEAVRPVLTRHGFSLSHRVDWLGDGTLMRVTGILAHRLGHARTSEFQSRADLSGSKNGIQGLGSTNSYGRRYTTCDLLGIATRELDDDGHTSGLGRPVGAPATRPARPTPGPAPRPEVHTVLEPIGFGDWALDLQTVAEEGTAALEAAWDTSRRDYRRYMVDVYGQKWTRLKARAAAVSDAARKAGAAAP